MPVTPSEREEVRKLAGRDAFFGLVALCSLSLLSLAAVYDWGRGWMIVFAFLAGVGFGWCLRVPAPVHREERKA